MQLTTETVRTAVTAALAEDQAVDDVTTRWSVPADLQVEATVVAKQAGRVAGLPLLQGVFAAVDPTVTVRPAVADGDPVLTDSRSRRSVVRRARSSPASG